jgi:hypothetical protein
VEGRKKKKKKEGGLIDIYWKTNKCVNICDHRKTTFLSFVFFSNSSLVLFSSPVLCPHTTRTEPATNGWLTVTSKNRKIKDLGPRQAGASSLTPTVP